MRYLLIISLFIINCFTALAQTDVAITGQILDASSGLPLAFGNVAVNSSPEGNLVTGAVSDDEGRFEIIGIPPGNYLLNFSFIGYTSVQQRFVAGGLNPVFDLGEIRLQPNSESLEEVEVVGEQAATNADLNIKTYNLDDNIAQGGGSVLDAMKTMPGVTFDQEGKVILRGSDKVVVLIDGKQSSLTGFGNQKGLGNIPASNIEKIEIINNPSAKYDANGFAGIINLVYKKEQKSGFSGDAGVSAGVGALGKRKADTPTELGSYSLNPKLIPSLSMNYKTKNLNYFLLSDFILQEALPNNEFTTRIYDDGRRIISQVPENRRQFRTIINGGVDWEIDPDNSITFSGLFDREKHIDTAQVAFVNLATNARNRFYTWREEEVTSFINAAVNYKRRYPQTGHTLSANAQYTRGLEDETYSLNDSSAVRVGRDKTNIRAIEHTVSLSADYTKPLKTGRIELGVNGRIRRLPVDYTITPGQNSIIYPNLGTYSDWGENLYAGYLNYVLEKEQYDIEAGLRVEQTEVFYKLDATNAYYPNNDDYSYFELFPSLRFTYIISTSNKVSAFYNRRIDRPGEPELRIFPKYDDPELLKVGNPYLRPQFTDALEIAHKYSWSDGSLFSAIYHRMIRDPYMRIYSVDDSNPEYDIINRIYQNTGHATNTGLELLFSQEVTEYWKLSASFNWYVNKIKAYEGQLLFPFERPFTIDSSSDNTGDGKLSNEFALPSDLVVQLTGVYYASRNIPQGEEKARTSVDVGVKKHLWQKRAELSLSASDLFNTFGIRQSIKNEGFTATYENFYETQILRLGFKYKF